MLCSRVFQRRERVCPAFVYCVLTHSVGVLNMTRDDILRMADIIRMADEANIEIFEEETMRFASLVYAAGAAAEREKCAKKCESYIAAGIGKEMADAIRAMSNE